jgi:Major Facilitator Superfamily
MHYPVRLRGLRTSPLAGRSFLLLAGGRTISMLGNAMAPVALAFAVLDITHHSARDLGIVLAARSVSTVTFLLLGGVIADRLPRHMVIVGSGLLAGVSESATAALLLTGHARIAVLAVLQVVNGASAACTIPSTSALVPQTVPAEMLRPANVVIRMGGNVTTIVGAALGGVVVAVAGPGWGIAIDAATFFVAAAMIGGIRVPRATGTQSATQSASMIRELAEGWREFWARTWLWVIVVQFAFINMAFGAAYAVLGPLVAVQRLGGAAAWGAIAAAVGAGLIVGGFVSAWRHHKRPLLAGNNALFLQLPMLALLALAAPLPLIAAAAVLAGAGIEIFGVRWVTTMQEQIPDGIQSRMFAYDALGSLLFVPVGQVLAGPLQGLLGTAGAIWAGTAVIGVAVLIVGFVPGVRAVHTGTVSAPQASSVPA